MNLDEFFQDKQKRKKSRNIYLFHKEQKATDTKEFQATDHYLYRLFLGIHKFSYIWNTWLDAKEIHEELNMIERRKNKEQDEMKW